MTVHIELSPQAQASLQARAAASGRPIHEYVTELVEQAAKRPSLEDLLAPVQADFARSGLTETELLDLGRRELDELREQRNRR